MDFEVQYIVLDGCILPIEPKELILEAFNIVPFKDFSFKIGQTDFKMDEPDCKKTFYTNLVEQLWSKGFYNDYDFTIVFCDKRFYNERDEGESRHHYFTGESLSLLGEAGQFRIIPALVNIQTVRKDYVLTNMGVKTDYPDAWNDILSVVRHEYGHPLGIEHCIHGNCVMDKTAGNTEFCQKDLKVIERSIDVYKTVRDKSLEKYLKNLDII